MKEVRYFFAPDAATATELPADEAQHAARVLRLHDGDEMFLMDGRGSFYRAEVTMVSQKHCMYKILETLPREKTWNGHIHIAMAPTKMMDRVEWFVEKATEVGADEFSFIGCKFSERKVLKTDRVEKIVISAVKQSRKPWKPRVNGISAFKDFILSRHDAQHKYICHCYDEISRTDLFETLRSGYVAGSDEEAVVLIGPEGDFSIDEVRFALAYGFKPVSLGQSRLRTETAALSAVMMLNLVMRK